MMPRSLFRAFAGLLCILSAVAAIASPVIAWPLSATGLYGVILVQDQSQPVSADAVVRSVVDAVQKHYLHTRNNPLWNIVRDHLMGSPFKNAAEVYRAIQQQLPQVNDSELNLLTPAEIAAVQDEALGKKIGLGLADFCIDLQVESGRARVVTPLVGSPAMNADVEPADVIVSVNGELTSDMNHEQVMDALRDSGPNGVKLQIERSDDKELNVTVIPSPEKPEVLQVSEKDVAGKHIAYIRIALFTPDLIQAVHDAIARLEQNNIDGYILDLRNNPGGFLNSALGVASLFGSGNLGFEVHNDDKKEPVASKGSPLTGKPLAVLINQGTASAAEFLAGALQGLKRGVLVGERTYGRGRGQIFVELPQDYGIQIPSVILLNTKGQEIRGKGIEPDIEVKQPQLPDSQRIGPKDQQFLRAVSALSANIH